MSFNLTSDDVIWAQSNKSESVAEKMFMKKEWSNPLNDMNVSSNYSSNQVIFDTTILSNNGQLCSYSEGILIFPIVINVQRSDNPNWTANDFRATDFMLALKNSHTQLIDRCNIVYNGSDISQAYPMTNAYLTFRQHTEFSESDLNTPLTGYAKDSSGSWYYDAPAGYDPRYTELNGTSRGCGLGNNCNFPGPTHSMNFNDSYNSGMLERQKLVDKYNSDAADPKLALLGGENIYKQTQKNHVINNAAGKTYFYDVIIRLKDLNPDLFSEMPLIMGARFKITLTLNHNVSFSFKKLDNGTIRYDFSTFNNATSETNPLMLGASYNTIRTQGGSEWEGSAVGSNVANTAGNYCFKITDDTVNNALIPCGLSTLDASDGNTYRVRMHLSKIGDISHPRQQCILYVPSYRLSNLYESQYFSPTSRIKKIHYTEVHYQNIETNSDFTKELISSALRPKRLIMIPILDKSENFGLNPCSSPFCTEPATCSPHSITNFNCFINNNNLFVNDITYNYDNFLQNMNTFGINSNQTNGLTSGLISLTDFSNIYGYLVIDLSRRLPEMDNITSSISVRGKVASGKKLQIHCYIEVERVLEIDVMTGALISKK